MPITTPYQFSFDGQTFGASTAFPIQSVDGLESLPMIRAQDDNRGYADGMFSGRDFLGGRTVSVIFTTLANGATSAQANYNTIQQALLPQTSGTTPLYFKLSSAGGEQFVNARVRALRTTVDPNYTYGYITSQVDFFCPIPLIYDSTLQTASMTLGGGLGRVYNRTYNLVYKTATAPFTVVNNAGWATTYPTITFNGPITNPIIGNQTQNSYLYFGYSFADTDICVIDLENKLVTLNGNSARNLVLGASEWFSAPPGNNNFYWSGSGTLVPTTSATVTWRNAYV